MLKKSKALALGIVLTGACALMITAPITSGTALARGLSPLPSTGSDTFAGLKQTHNLRVGLPAISPARASIYPFPSAYRPNVSSVGGNGYHSYQSQTSDPFTGWGDDAWKVTTTQLTQITVTVNDCCLVGDNYEVYITRNLRHSEDLIGTTPFEDINATTLSTGTFTKYVAPGTHYIAIRDPGGVYWYSQGYTELANPAGYEVDIDVEPATITHPAIFVHGINTSSTDPGFSSVLSAVDHIYGRGDHSTVEHFVYHDDISLAGAKDHPKPCPASISPRCVSQSGVLENATKLASMVQQLYAQAEQTKVTLIGHSMGGAIIRTMLAGCPASLFTNEKLLCPDAAAMIDSVYFISAVQQGSWTAADQPAEDAIATANHLTNVSTVDLLLHLQPLIAWQQHLDLANPAERDLMPQSSVILAQNLKQPPSGIHYFNFYGNIQVRLQTQVLWWPITPPHTISVGDFIILPGTDNPQDTPESGGSRICLHCASHGSYLSSEPGGGTTYMEWPLTDTKTFGTDAIFNYLENLLPGGSQAQSGVNTGIQTAILARAPEAHWNVGSASALQTIKVQDTTGAGGKVTIQQEIALQMEAESGIEP